MVIRNDKKIKWGGMVLLLVISVCIAGYLEIFFEIANYSRTGTLSGFAGRNPQIVHLLRLSGLWIAVVGVGLLLWKYHPPILHWVYRYRYVLALVVLTACVLLEISGSSIACMSKYIGSDPTGVLFGIPRDIRSDEFATITPFTFSQYYNGSGQYPYFTETIRGTLTDTFIAYGLPSWNICTIFRPFVWGYLLFGPARGLSFFWVARLLTLFLVSFEFAMVYTKANKWLSLAAGMLIAFAPTVQWWFAVCGLAEMLIFSQGTLLCLHHYMRAQATSRKIMAAILMFWCLGGYIFALYPAWQIAFGFVLIALLVYVALESKAYFRFHWKADVPILGVGLLLLSASVVYILYKSHDTIGTIMNTVYPGARSDTGGNGFFGLFKYGTSLFFPLTGQNLNTNTCEASAFFDLFPIGIVLSLYVILIEKKRDRMLIPLLTAQAILVIYCTFGLPGFLAKVTLLSYSPANRVLLAVGLINVLLLIRSISIAERKPRFWAAAAVSLALAVGVGLLCRAATGDYINKALGAAMLGVLSAGFFLSFIARSVGTKKLFALFCTMVVLVSGGLVNPVQQGINVIYQNEIVQEIESIANQDSGLWIVEGSYPLTNVPIMVGAPTINSTNVYPDLERWHQLDPDGQYESVYNRYAHINVTLTDEETRFDLLQADQFLLTLSFKDMEKLNVGYVLSAQDYSTLDNIYVDLIPIAHARGYYIYKLSYLG